MYSISPTAYAFIDSPIGVEELSPTEFDCLDGIDDDDDGYTDFEDPDC